jgi:predicted permease
MTTLLFTLTLILCALLLGYALQRLIQAGRVHLPVDIAVLRKLLQKISLLFFMPISFLGAVWVVSFGDIRVIWLPVIGAVALLTGGFLGLLFSKILRVDREQIGVMYCCGSFTNIGGIGALICFLFLGEQGFALVALYKIFEETIYYSIGFPIAKYFGHGEIGQGSRLRRLVTVFKDPFVATILTAMAAGLLLNLSGFDRPVLMGNITGVFVLVGTFVLIFSIGLGMRFSSVGKYWDKCLAISAIKFILVPIVACTLAYLVNLHEIAGGIPFKVVAILSSMPVAFNALVAASIFDLDLELANSLWLVTTGLLVLVIPCLYFFLL